MPRRLTLALGTTLLAAGWLLAVSPSAQASRPFTRVTRLECGSCHKSKDEKDMSEKDLNLCGLAADRVLKEGGYRRPPGEAEKLKAAQRLLKDFKCPGT